MKTVFYILILALSISIGFAQNDTARVNKINGLLIFTSCDPLAEYEVLGEVQYNPNLQSWNSGHQYPSVKESIINQTNQLYNNAEGLIMLLGDGGKQKATVIKFKEDQINTDLARVKFLRGFLVYVDNRPQSKYKHLGTSKNSYSAGGHKYKDVLGRLLNKCREDYANAQGVIVNFVNQGTDTADAIVFE